MVREKGGVSAERIASNPAFLRTQEKQAEFGRAGKASKLLRTAIRPLLQSAADSRMVSRLHNEMMRVVKADSTSARSLRNVLDGELELLLGFEFNEAGKLGQTFFAQFTTTRTCSKRRCFASLFFRRNRFLFLKRIGFSFNKQRVWSAMLNCRTTIAQTPYPSPCHGTEVRLPRGAE